MGIEGHRRTVRLSRELVKHLAWLARIELSDEEVDRILPQLARILEFFHEMDEAPVEGLEPAFTVLEGVYLLRPDEARPGLSQEEALMNAPDKEGGFIKAPRIL